MNGIRKLAANVWRQTKSKNLNKNIFSVKSPCKIYVDQIAPKFLQKKNAFMTVKILPL